MVNNRSPRRRRTTTTAATAAAANDNTMPSPRTVSRAQLGLRVIPPASTDPRSQSPARSTRRRKLLAEDEGEDTVHAAAHAHEDNHEDGKLEVQQDCKPSPSKDDMPTAAPTPSSSANDVIGTGSIQNVHCFSAFHSHPHQAHLGTLLGHRVAKEFFESDDEDRKVGTGKLYLGTVAAYSLPRDTKAEDGEKGADGTVAKEDVRVWDGTYHPSISATDGSSTNSSHCTISGPNNSPSKKTKPRKKQTKAAAARIAHAAKGITGVGIYRVLFDDGETDDQDPTETYECALEYHWQRQHRLDGTTATNTKRQRPVLAQDHSPTKPGALKSKGQVVSTEAGERELRRNANPPLIAAASGSNVGGNNVCRVRILDMELLGFWLAHEGYHRGIGIARPSPLVGSKSFVGWSELDEAAAAAAAAAGNVEKDETPDDMMGSTCTIKKKKKKKRGRSHKIERARAPIAPTVWTEEEEGKTLPLPKKRRCSPQKKEQSTTEAAAPPAEGIEEEEEETMLPQSKKRRGRPPKKEQSNREESMDRDESESDASEHGECNVDDGRAIVERDDSHGGETARVAGRIVHSKKRPGDDVVQDDQSNYEVKEGERSLDEEEEEDVQPQIAEVVPRALDALANARPLPHVPNNENELSMHSSSELSLPLEDGEQNAGQPTIGEGSRPGSPTPRSPVARRTAIRPRGRPAASLVQAAPAPAAMPPPDRSPPSLIDASMSSAGGSRIVDQVPPMNEMLSHQGSVQLESVAHESPPSPRLAARSPPPKRLGITQSPTWQRKSPSLVPASGKLCKVEGCGKFKQSGKNDMCCSHFTESQRAHEQLQLHSVEDYGHKDGWAEDEDSLIRDAILKAPRVHGAISEAFLTLAEGPLSHRSQSAIESRWFCVLRRSHEKTLEARSEAEARKVRPSYFCIVDGCSKQRQSGKGGMCCSHFTESQEMAEETSESEDETQASIGVGRNNRWTEEEDEIIRDAIQTSSTAKEAFLALAAGPLSHRSWSAIQNHWYADVKPSVGEESSESEDEDEEKTPVSNGVGRSNRWTEEEDEIIRDAIQTSATAKEAFLALAAGPLSHRSWSAIQNHWYADVKPSMGDTSHSGKPPRSSTSKSALDTLAKAAAAQPLGSRLPNLKWTDEEIESLISAVEEARRNGRSKEDAFNEVLRGALSHRSLNSIRARWYNTKQAPKKSASAASSSSGSPSEEIEDPNGDLTRGLPSSSDDWIYPETTNISLSHPDAVHHKETSKSLKIPSHQRLVAVPNRSESESLHTFILSVYVSTVPNAGRGLFLTYCGPDAYWTVPDYVDLGCYGPHTASDIKQDFLMEVKNFLYHDNPSEWSFDAPKPPSDEESSEAQGLTVHGKKIIKDMLFDITDDATGEVHAMAEQTLLPFVNEVTVQGKNASQKLKQVQNIDAVHHDDGTLHYLLRSGSRFKRGKTTELFVYYGAQYDGNRNRKHSAYSDRKECNHHSPVVMVKDRAGGDGDDMSGITDPPSNSGGIIIANDCGLLTASGHPIQRSVCPSCNEHSTKLCVKTTASLSQYTNMRKSIFTYTEKDIIAVLDLFISSPPIESVPRQRMWWIADQIRPYLSQILYRNGEQKIPPALQAKLDLVFDLFPRGRDTPYHDDDEDAKKKHKYMGVAIRKEVGTSGFKTGMVEHMVSSSSGSIDDVLGVEQRKYLVVYFSGEGEEIVTEQEIIDGLLPNSFGMLG